MTQTKPLVLAGAQMEQGPAYLAGACFSSADISTQALSTIVARAVFGYAWTMPASLPNSVGKVTTAPSANTSFDLQVNGSSVGTVTWLSGSTTPTFNKASDSNLSIGDYLDLVTPSNLNGMAGAFGLTIIGTR